MKRFAVILTALLVLLTATASARTVEQEQARIEEVHAEALDRFFSKKPYLEDAVQSAYGYATLSSSRVLLFGRGRGMAVNNETGERVYIKMDEINFLGLGIGLLGCIEYDMLMTFEDRDAWEQFMRGKTKTSVTTVAVASGNDRPSGSGNKTLTARNVTTYTLTKKGLEVSVGWSAIKIYAPKKLNGGY